VDAAKLVVLLFFRSNLGTCGIKSDQTIKMKMVARNIFFYWCIVLAAGQSGDRNMDYLFSKILSLDRDTKYH
jgi:hypothetical protein